MAEKLTFELVSPERLLASKEAGAVTIPGMAGDLTALPGHAPFLTTLRPGTVAVYAGTDMGGDAEKYFVTGGFAEIADGTIAVLAEEAFPADEIDDKWLDQRIAEREAALGEVSEDRLQAETQRLNDLRALRM